LRFLQKSFFFHTHLIYIHLFTVSVQVTLLSLVFRYQGKQILSLVLSTSLFTLTGFFHSQVFLSLWCSFFIHVCSFYPQVFFFHSCVNLFHPGISFFTPECSFSPKCVPLLTLCSCTLTLSLLIHCLIYSFLIAQFSHTVEEIH